MKTLVDNKTKQECREDYNNLFIKCKMLPVQEKVLFILASDHYSSDEYKVPVNYTRILRNVRQGTLCIPKTINYYGERTTKYLVPKLFNDIPQDIANCKSKPIFKRKLGEYLLVKYKNLIDVKGLPL